MRNPQERIHLFHREALMKSPTNLAEKAAEDVIAVTPAAVQNVNSFTKEIFHTRGGRIGSGMGSVVEALWGFHTNELLHSSDYELGWIYGHEYNDFACISSSEDWEPATRAGELFRVEVKSMVASADESKAHFDRLVREFDQNELLAVFLWDWTAVSDESRMVYPAILDYFVGLAIPVARLRDELHLGRGGTFVAANSCPDKCGDKCTHIGEPLNAAGVRERRSGPSNARGANVSYAANFGGLLRMLGSRGSEGREILRRHYNSDATTARFLDFMSKNFPRVARAMS
jgi:hypothetical protein